MADSMITKKAFASALKELTKELPYSKITVGKICKQCDMNRTSFYYHFRDKYDLVNWIFDTEFVKVFREANYTNIWDSIRATTEYFYDNQKFYAKVLEFNGQNSFSDHFRSLLRPMVYQDIHNMLRDQQDIDFQVNFFTDALISAIERWVKSKDTVPPDEFVKLLSSCISVALDRAAKYQDELSF